MLPVARIVISGLSSIGAGMIASKLTKPLVSNGGPPGPFTDPGDFVWLDQV